MPRVEGRVAHLSTAHPARDNRIFHKECRALQEAGLDVWLIIPQEGDEDAEGVIVHGLPRRGSRLKRMLLGQFDAWRALNKVQPSLVQFHDPELIPVVALWKTIHRRKAVYDAHEDLEKQVDGKPYLPGWAKGVARLFSRLIIAMADRCMDGIVVATPNIAKSFLNQSMIVVHNFPWLREFPAAAGRAAEQGCIVYVGGMSEARSFSTMTRIVAEIPGAELLLAGPMDAEAAAAFAVLPEGSAVQYRGALPARSVPAVIAGANLGMVLFKNLPNNVESLPTKLFEYMASGIPFVATDFPYWQDLLGEIRCGVFVDVDNEKACVDAVAGLLANPSECHIMGQRGRAAVENRFNFDVDAERFVEFTRSVLGAAIGPTRHEVQSNKVSESKAL